MHAINPQIIHQHIITNWFNKSTTTSSITPNNFHPFSSDMLACNQVRMLISSLNDRLRELIEYNNASATSSYCTYVYNVYTKIIIRPADCFYSMILFIGELEIKKFINMLRCSDINDSRLIQLANDIETNLIKLKKKMLTMIYEHSLV